MVTTKPHADSLILERERFPLLLEALVSMGYRLVGPTLREQAIMFDEIHGVADLPEGWTDEQGPGYYRLKRRNDLALFGYAVGPQSWKRQFFVPTLKLLSAQREGAGFVVDTPEQTPVRLALIGARACDLRAIAIQDQVFTGGPYVEEDYARRREDVFVVAINCAVAGGTCFCASMGTGPRATRGFDLALTELLEGGHRFVVEVGSERGEALIERLETRKALEAEIQAVDATVEATVRAMGRHLDTTDIRNLLARNLEHPRWDEVAQRCLGCTNCTLVCPTCFCSSIEDVTDLSGAHADRIRTWDSCFTLGHSYLHGGSVRDSLKSRYRQWLTHKLGTWIDQFGTSGCVGCGRCITWCPVGIDITEETGAIRATDCATRVSAKEP